MIDEEMVDPDGETNSKYEWDEDFQRHIISMLLVDKTFLLQARDIVKPSYFEHKAHSKACEILFNYFDAYKCQPSRLILTQELKDQLKEHKALSYYLGELNTIYDYFQPGLDAIDYLTDKIVNFAKIQALKIAFHKSMDEINRNPESDASWSKVYKMLQDAMLVDRGFDMGTNYLRTARDRYKYMETEEETGDVFPTGFPSVDQELKGGGYRRGESFAIMADSGVGKSVCLACIVAYNALRGKKCLYISCENSELDIANRLDAILTGTPIRSLVAHQHEVFEKLEGRISVGLRDDGQPVYFSKEDDLILIKKFPQKSADVNTIRAYVMQCKMRGFTPDLVIVDYIGEMKDFPGIKTYESRERLMDELTGLAGEENFCVGTALQPNREGKEAQEGFGHLSQANMADSFGQMRALSGCITLNQNEREGKMCLGRGWVEKQRNGRKHYQFYLNFDAITLKITEIGQQTYKDRMATQSEKVLSEIEVDSVKSVNSKAENNIIDNVAKQYKPSEGKHD